MCDDQLSVFILNNCQILFLNYSKIETLRCSTIWRNWVLIMSVKIFLETFPKNIHQHQWAVSQSLASLNRGEHKLGWHQISENLTHIVPSVKQEEGGKGGGCQFGSNKNWAKTRDHHVNRFAKNGELSWCGQKIQTEQIVFATRKGVDTVWKHFKN